MLRPPTASAVGPRAVIVLDHPGTFLEGDDLLRRSVSLSNFSSLTTFRRLHRSELAKRMADACIDGVHTAVEYIDSRLLATIVLPAPRRLVMNMRGDPLVGDGGRDKFNVVSSETVREYVFIFWPALSYEEWYFGVIFDIVYPEWRDDDYESVTVVGLETLCDLGTAADSAADREDAAGVVRERMRRHYYARNAEKWPPDYRRSIVDPLCDRLRFVRRDEWRAELGEQRAEEVHHIVDQAAVAFAHCLSFTITLMPTASIIHDGHPHIMDAILATPRIHTRSPFPVLPFCPGAVQALDLNTMWGMSEAQADAFTALHTLRRLLSNHRTRDTMRPRTLIQDRIFRRDRFNCRVYTPVVPASVERLVADVIYETPRLEENGQAWNGPLRLDRLPPKVVYTFAFGTWPETMTLGRAAEWLFDTIEGHDTQVTVVGLDALLPDGADEDVAQWFHSRRDLLAARHGGDADLGLDLVDRALDQMRFVPSSEWEAPLPSRLKGDEMLMNREGPAVSPHRAPR
ncbi:uncharacterized protein LOC62_04G005327 [Vanrija pseudolonga]|uniref:Uncharacterized protein n=1 Tax=Vanrija pseudolonga TaxID=143232 RepID=A0AAF1BR75_9TREE|nr:hypothetical protein LOC62_04G005327 [Vanrija pseudolonga]